MFLTPSGRFETGTKVCLSFSAYHPELWQPAWGIRLILEALISFLPTPADGAIGALDWTSEERKRKKVRNHVKTFTQEINSLFGIIHYRLGKEECVVLLSSVWTNCCLVAGTKRGR